jgi:hypothetical protein
VPFEAFRSNSTDFPKSKQGKQKKRNYEDEVGDEEE